ncbi:helix-turn-helix domain-containing protein [Candidatus Parcubacteria bacterium]|nr:helix-turn-helix domain-containing protein [Candidatus Parcubacteria bacterium]
MNNLLKKYNELFTLKNSKKLKESFSVAMFQTRLSSKIFQARAEKKMSQQKLRESAQTTQRIISDIENGNYNMGINLLYKIFKALNKQLIVDGEDLITGEQIISTNYYIITSTQNSEFKENQSMEYPNYARVRNNFKITNSK